MSILYFPGEKNQSVIELPGQQSVLTSWWWRLPTRWTGVWQKKGHFSLLWTQPARAMPHGVLGYFITVQTWSLSQDSPDSFRCLPCICHKTLPRLDKDHPSSLPCSPLPAFVIHPNVPTRLLFFCDCARMSLQTRRCQSRGHYTRGIWTNSRPLVFSESSHIVMLLLHQLLKLCLTFWTLPFRSLHHSIPPSPILLLIFLLLP